MKCYSVGNVQGQMEVLFGRTVQVLGKVPGPGGRASRGRTITAKQNILVDVDSVFCSTSLFFATN